MYRLISKNDQSLLNKLKDLENPFLKGDNINFWSSVKVVGVLIDITVSHNGLLKLKKKYSLLEFDAKVFSD